ncbi:hypothetical protein HAX54_029372, partial [Datura stramonium]|nr:hypothetical protein [Datura stramonium]
MLKTDHKASILVVWLFCLPSNLLVLEGDGNWFTIALFHNYRTPSIVSPAPVFLPAVSQVSRNFSSLKAQVIQERVQQVHVDSSIVVAQVAEEGVQQVPRDTSTLETQDVHDQVQEASLNFGENELPREQ